MDAGAIKRKRRRGAASESADPSTSTSSFYKLLRSSARLRTHIVPQHVFNNDLLLEMILKYAIHKPDGSEVDLGIARILRQVGRAWNASIIKTLHKCQQPFCQLSIWRLERCVTFCNLFGSNARGFVPPFKLSISSRDLEQLPLNHKTIRNLLSHSGPGAGLIQLDMWIHPFRGPFPKSSLPNLRKLDIMVVLDIPSTRFSNGVDYDKDEGVQEQRLAVAKSGEKGSAAILKSVFEATTGLSELTMSVSLPYSRQPILVSSGLETVTLPISVTKLTFRYEIRGQDLEVLTNSHLPNLTSFTVQIGHTDPYREGLLSDFLSKCRTTLKVVSFESYLCPDVYPESPRSLTMILLPLMDNLEKFSNNSINAEIETGFGSQHTFLPKLHTLRLRNQTEDMLRKWTTGSAQFTLVTHLELAMVAENVGRGSYYEKVSVDMDTMLRISKSFPNILLLELTLSEMEASVLRIVFREMTQITELRVKVFQTRSGLPGRRNYWDTVLTGVPPELRAKNPVSDENPDSIANLKELVNLSLGHKAFGGGYRFISDVTFRLALLRMPKLKGLNFQGNFKVSNAMSKKWKKGAEGRTLIYNP